MAMDSKLRRYQFDIHLTAKYRWQELEEERQTFNRLARIVGGSCARRMSMHRGSLPCDLPLATSRRSFGTYYRYTLNVVPAHH